MKNKVYSKVLSEEKISRPYVKNAFRAFLVGGIISLIGQGLLDLFQKVFLFEFKVSQTLMSLVLVFVTAILTGIGVFDRIGEFSGAGSYIPITGFSNSMASAALESKSEGIVLGIMSNMFKLAGAVIVAGIVSAMFTGLILYFFRMV